MNNLPKNNKEFSIYNFYEILVDMNLPINRFVLFLNILFDDINRIISSKEKTIISRPNKASGNTCLNVKYFFLINLKDTFFRLLINLEGVYWEQTLVINEYDLYCG